MKINSKVFNEVIKKIERGYESLPGDTAAMKDRKENMLKALSDVYDLIISKGINNITSNHILELAETTNVREQETVLNWICKELNLYDLPIKREYIKYKAEKRK